MPTQVRIRWRAILFCLIALLFSGVALRQLQGLLAGMHLSGRPSLTLGSLNHLVHMGADPDKTEGALRVWREHDAAIDQVSHEPADAYVVTWWFFLIDSLLFAPLCAAVLILFLGPARKRVLTWHEHRDQPTPIDERLAASDLQAGPALTSYALIAKYGFGFALAALVADWIENGTTLGLVAYGWQSEPDYGSTLFGLLVWGLWLAGWAKWILYGLAVLSALVLAWVLSAGRSRGAWGRVWPSIRHSLFLLRLHLPLVLVFALLLFGHEQLPDLVRRWTVGQLAVAIVLSFTFALVIWLVGRRLIVRGCCEPDWDANKRKRMARWSLITIIALAAFQAIGQVVTSGSYRIGWGLLIPAVACAVLAAMSAVLPPTASGGSPPQAARAEEEEVSAGAASEYADPVLPRLLAAIVVLASAFGLFNASFGYAVYTQQWTSKALVPLVGVALGIVFASVFARGDPLLWAIAGVFILFIPLALFDQGDTDPSGLVVVAILLAVAAPHLYSTLKRVGPPSREVSMSFVGLLALILVVIYTAIVGFPLETGAALSAIGVGFLFLIVIAITAAGVVWVTPAIPVPRSLQVLGIKYFPVVTLLIVWFLAASYIDKGGYHDFRLKDAQAPAAGITLDDAWHCWLGRNGLEENQCSHDNAPSPSVSRSTPLVLISSTGGGIRAAYWTDLVLDCVFEVQPGQPCPRGAHETTFERSDRLFALSGISGGSFGIASYAAYLVQKGSSGAQVEWFKDRLDEDALSGSAAWWLFVEIPRAFLQFRIPTDRAAVLEHGWEDAWPDDELDHGLFDLWRNHHEVPLMLFNGTSVQDGCRFETSILNGNIETTAGPAGCRSTEPFDDLGPVDGPPTEDTRIEENSVLPATRDLVDFLCGDEKDVRLSTAALLSGRFPFVNPSGRIESRCDVGEGARRPVAYVVDGGYLETSGASPVLELMESLGPKIDEWNRANRSCVVPVMIQIDNGFEGTEVRPSRRPGELTVPLKTNFSTRLGRAAEGRTGAALIFSRATETTDLANRYTRFINQAHPGPGAPLGWTQSRFSQDELTAQLSQDQNRRALAEARSWLAGMTLSCKTD